MAPQHVRSISLPSKSHQLAPQVDEHSRRLRSSESTSPSLSSISNSLSILEDMYDSLDDLLLLPNTQQAFTKNEKWAGQILDGYLRLLDLFSTAKDISSNVKQDVQSLLSVLRRRRDGNELEICLNSWKQTKKVIQRSLKDFKNIKTKHMSTENEAISSTFLEFEYASAKVLESLILYILGSKPQSKLTAFVNKSILKNTPLSKGEENVFENVDVALDLLLKKKTDDYESLQSQLAEMESSMENLEEGLECLFRHSIKTRVFILNILNHQ